MEEEAVVTLTAGLLCALVLGVGACSAVKQMQMERRGLAPVYQRECQGSVQAVNIRKAPGWVSSGWMDKDGICQMPWDRP